jgi:large subunit ribosomal protein L5
MSAEKKKTRKAKEEKGSDAKGTQKKKPERVEKPRLLLLYNDSIRAKLMKELNKKNVHEVPKLTKITISMGVGAATQDNQLVLDAAEELGLIAGQKPVIIRAKRSVSNFKLREGMQIGCKVTLRGERMYEFLERLICIVLPRIRDFRGTSPNAFDGRGNYSLGIDDQLVFPEINPDKAKRTQGMNIAFVTTAETDHDGRELLREFGMPFAGK